jgi:hypothetical protein
MASVVCGAVRDIGPTATGISVLLILSLVKHDPVVAIGNQPAGLVRPTGVKRLATVLIVLSVVTSASACSDDDDAVSSVGGGEVVGGPAQADIDDEPPYGAGAEVGETYEYTLYTHCGIEWTRIDGVWWRAPLPLSDGNANPPPGWGNPYDKGEMKIVDKSTAVYQGGAQDVEFERTDEVDAPFACE